MKDYFKKIYNYLKNIDYRFYFIYIIIGIVIVASFIYLLRSPEETEAAWWNETWSYRQRVKISNDSAFNGSDVPYRVIIDTATLISDGKLQADADDIRVVDSFGNIKKYQVEESTLNTSETGIWFEASISQNNSEFYFIYYGNSSATAYSFTSDVDAVFSTANKIEMTDNFDYTVSADGGTYGQFTDIKYNNVDLGVNSVSRHTDSYPPSDWWNVEGLTRTALNSTGPLFAEIKYEDTDYGNYSSYGTIIMGFANGYISERIYMNYNTSTTEDLYHYLSFTSSTRNAAWVDANGDLVDQEAISGTLYEADLGDNWFGQHWTSTGHYGATVINPNGSDWKYGHTSNVASYYQTNYSYSESYSDGESRSIRFATIAGDGGISEMHEKGSLYGAYTVTYSTEQVNVAPIGYWSFDEGYGSTAYDSSSSQSNGTISGAIWQSEDLCISGKCLKFDGSNDYVSFSSIAMDLSENHSVSIWFKVNEWDTYSPNSIGAGLMQGPNSRSWDDLISLRYSGTQIYLQDDTGVSKSISLSSPVSLNSWYHLTINIETTGIRAYINGEYQGSTSAFSSSNTLTIDRIGMGYGSDPTIDGSLDEPKIYNYARSTAQIRRDYNAGASGFSGTEGVGVGIGQRPQQYLSQGLIGYWKMDGTGWDGTPAEVIDSSGAGSHGTSSTVTASTTAKFGGSSEFNGTSSYIDLADLDIYDFGSNDFTVSAWARRRDDPINYQNQIITKWNTGASPGTNEWGLNTGSGGSTSKTPGFAFESGTTAYTAVSSDEIASQEWYHVLGMRKGEYIYIYVDGEEKASTYIGSIAVNNASGRSLEIGRIAAGYEFDGNIDEVRVYNRSLSSREVRDLYNWAPGPIAHIKMDEGSGSTAYDRSTNQKNVTLYNSPTWTSGKFGQALSFNGTDQYGLISSDDTLFSILPTRKQSFSFWIKADSYATKQVVLSRRNGCNNDAHFNIYAYANDLYFALYSDGDTAYSSHYTSGDVLTNSEWYHVEWVKEWGISGGTKLYLNGSLQSLTLSNEIASGASYSSLPVYVGAQKSGSSCNGPVQDYFNGIIDDVRIYNYARTPKQVIEDMNAGHPAGGSPIASQFGYWKFDEGYGSTAYDYGYGDNDGTITNATSTNNGKFSRGLDFDGDGHVTGSLSGFTSLNRWTASTWFRTSDNQAYIFDTRTSNDDGAVIYSSSATVIHAALVSGSTLYKDYLYTITELDGNWHYIALSRDGDNSLTLYIDGIAQTPSSIDTDVDMTSVSETWTNFTFGNRHSLDAYQLSGTIDEFKLYGSALTEDEILIDYNKGSSLVLGASGQETTGVASSSASVMYCIPGDTATCDPPVAEYKLDERTGSSAYDTSNNNNTGTITNGTWQGASSCIKGSCMLFDGNDEISVSDNAALDLTTTGTVAVWAKIDSYNSGQYPHIVGKGASAGWDTDGYAIWIYSDNYIRGELDDEAETPSNDYVSFGKPSTGEWHYYVMTWDGTTIYAYLDGALSTASPSSDTQRFSVPNTAVDLEIGRRGNYFNGSIDEVRLYDYARTPAQVAYSFNRGASVGYWKFDECSGSTIYDWAPNSNGGYNGNNGSLIIGTGGTNTATGTCATSGAWNDGATGKINASMEFDGTDDYLSMGDKSTHDWGSGDGTVSAWFKTSTAGIQDIVQNGSYSTNAKSYTILLDTNSKFAVSIDDNTTAKAVISDTSGNDGLWHHIVGVRDGNDLRLYIDGIEDANSPTDITGYGDIDISDPLMIGAGTNGTGGSPGNFYTGQIDEVKIFNYALTNLQVKQVYNNGAVNFK
ncbi:DUF2341 domain-containing protein [bacterium]|jgi:hypothetical protein|nr:DUF2341 domain-containing protein [bacterium]MBT5400857.1 DUF2341 domain-containing protein [bacterium]MBT5942178.1 DUF2341 domain-containing protein [bacterium]MBT6067265.1 DUF2341 domain-containing protein [bacterium]MBT6335168.1 DUF2341 domain-containing protein [bacterium]